VSGTIYKVVRNLMRRPIPLQNKSRRGLSLVVPSGARRFTVGPEHFDTPQFRGLLEARPGSPPALVVLSEETAPATKKAKKPPKKPLSTPKLEMSSEDKIRRRESIENPSTFSAKGKTAKKTKNKSKNKSSGTAAKN